MQVGDQMKLELNLKTGKFQGTLLTSNREPIPEPLEPDNNNGTCLSKQQLQ